MLGLGYPGGPEIEKMAHNRKNDIFKFPIARIKKSKYNFSFSGLKTSLYYLLKKKNNLISKKEKQDIASGYQEAILDALIQKLVYVCNELNIHDIVISGGVTSNKRFRDKLNSLNEQDIYKISYPPIKYCTDNAAMISIAGYEKLLNKNISDITLDVYPNLLMSEK